jgi:uncharacterized repeat protein (TIGR03803 family)
MRLMIGAMRLAALVGVAIATAATAAGHYQVEVSFRQSLYSGPPDSDLAAYQGKLYGAQDAGVYDFDPTTGAATLVHHFTDGGRPDRAGLTSFDGKLYGTLYSDRVQNDGAIYALDPTTGREQIVYAFKGGADGCGPIGDLVRFGRLLYGATLGCGDASGDGTVYAFDPVKGVETVVHAFQGVPDGTSPTGGLTVVGGDLYGTTNSGGVSTACFLGCGTVFEINPSTDAETVLHSFGSGADGAHPNGALTQADGKLYGVTYEGGVNETCYSAGCGVIFSLDPATHAETVAYAFKNGIDGDTPEGHVTKVGKLLYGVTGNGGAHAYGTVFAFDPKRGAKTILHAFRGGADGAAPLAGLTYSRHRLYGTTTADGVGAGGTVFSIRP